MRGSARLRASLDRRCDQRSVGLQAGAEKRRSNRTEKHEGQRRSGEGWTLQRKLLIFPAFLVHQLSWVGYLAPATFVPTFAVHHFGRVHSVGRTANPAGLRK